MIAEPTKAPPPTVHAIEQTINRLVDVAKVDTIFGRPIERDGVTVIPCSEVMLGLGLGGGSGTGPAKEEKPQGTGEGIGGGGGARGRPVAVVVVTRDKVQVQPILNVTRVALSFFTTLGFVAFSLSQLLIARRTGPPFRRLTRADLRRAMLMRRAIRRGRLNRGRGRLGLLRLALARIPGRA